MKDRDNFGLNLTKTVPILFVLFCRLLLRVNQNQRGDNPMTDDQMHDYEMNLNNWQPLSKLSEYYPQFNKNTLKHLFIQRHKKIGLSRCYMLIGRSGFVNVALFGLWLAGQLPEQTSPPF